MGTRSLTIIKDHKDTFCTIYRQYDGYLEGHGKELAVLLADMRLVNGFQSQDKAGDAANGIGCLAAQLIAKLKDGIGNVYLSPNGVSDVGEEFTYTIYPGEEMADKRSTCVNIMAQDGDKIVFDGPAKDLLAFIAAEAAKV